MQTNIYSLIAISLLLGLVLFVPFINLLYKLGFYRSQESGIRKDAFGKTAEVFESLKNHKTKIATPIGGGILVFLLSIVIFLLATRIISLKLSSDLVLILISISGFFIIGLYDDLKKFFRLSGGVWGLRARYKLLFQFAVASPAILMVINQQQSSFLTVCFVVFFSTLVVYMANCFNITDGLDGLSMGTFSITLVAMLVIAITKNFTDHITFLSILLGTTLSYLYFNTNPARIMLGDAGALSFGALIGFFSLVTNTWYLLPLYSIVFLIDGTSSLVQISHKVIFKKKLFLIAPFHHLLEAKGWDETKVTTRLWLLNVFGVIVALAVFTAITNY